MAGNNDLNDEYEGYESEMHSLRTAQEREMAEFARQLAESDLLERRVNPPPMEAKTASAKTLPALPVAGQPVLDTPPRAKTGGGFWVQLFRLFS